MRASSTIRESSRNALDLAALNMTCLKGWVRDNSATPPPMRRMVKESLGSGCSQHHLPKVVDPSWFNNLPERRIAEENLGPGCS